MANKDDYLTSYRKFFEYFAQTVNPNDQLPVKLGCYKLLKVEVIGGIIDWTTQYLSQKKCPPHLYSPLIKIIIEEIRICCEQNPHNYGFNLTDNAYEPLKLMQAVMAKTNEVCLRYRDNSMLCSLPVPSTTYYETSIFAIRNRRRKMEDRHVAIHDLNTMFNIQEASPSSYYAVFDGHAGHDAAAYSAAHLHQFLAENKYFMSNPEQALLDAFCKTDAFFLEKCQVENLTGGTTAVVALLRPKEKTLYIAWVGDSQALLVKQGKALQCVNPHKPSREDERHRIEKAGGCVMLWGTWRVNGQLAVSRAIGDAEYKPHVIAIPDVREISLDGNEDFLIIACDGLWDYLSENTAAQQVYYMIAQNPDDTEIIGRHLSQLARYQGSTDNISIIVVFLKEPHQIAAEAHRLACLNGPALTTDNNMETGLDNANNPFTNSNGSLKNLEVDTDNIELRKDNDGLMLNLAGSFKTNARGIKQELFMTEKSNGTKNSASDIHFDDDFGPETDVDAIDDAFSPLETEKAFTDGLAKGLQDEGIPKAFTDEVKAFTDGLANNNPLEVDSNPFLNDQNEKGENGAEMNFEDFCGANREETPTPPVDTVHDVGGLEVNPTESDSEDEWNYIKGDQAKPETSSSQPETVVETSEQEDAMSQLNPDAAEFVPVSPTRSIPSPACRALMNEEVLSQSPKLARQVDISVPSEDEFDLEVKFRPKDVQNYKNGHESDSNNTLEFEEIEKMLNHKNIDEIPEFHPGSTPNKQLSDEFHFGPNATPFTPKSLDQSDAFSTKANHGDETQQTLEDSEFVVPGKEQTDPMSMSFYAEKGESNPFEDEDLNKVHVLPDNLDEFIGQVTYDKENLNVNYTMSEKVEPNPYQDENDHKKENVNEFIGDEDKNSSNFDDTISDLPEHEPLGKRVLDNDQAIQITDLDKISQDDEKELASPVEENEQLLNIPFNDNVFQQNVEEKLLPQEFEFINDPLNPVVLEKELLAKSPNIESESLVPENIEQEPFLNDSENLVCEFAPGNKISENDSEVPKSPECELKSASSFPEAEVTPKSEVENIQSHIEEVASTLACEYTATSPVPVCEEASSPVLVCESPVINESCEIVSKESSISEQKQDKEIVSHSPTDVLRDLKQDEDVTSSIKDDVSSQIEPLSPVKIGQKDDEEVTSSVEDFVSSPIEASPGYLQKSLLEEIATAGEHGSTIRTDPSEIESQNIEPDLLCPLSISQPILAPTETENQLFELNQNSALSNGFNNFSSEFNEQICIKTDSITPEFAEPAVITPSEESKMDDIVAESPVLTQGDILVENVPTPETTIAEKIEAPKTEAPKEIAAVAPLPVLPVVQEVKSDDKKLTSAKKTIGKVELKKPTASKVGAAKAPTASKVGLSARPAPKLGTAKPTGAITKATATSTTALKVATKPKTTSRLLEKKPASNGEVKPAPRTTLTKKPAAEAPATKTTTRPATTAAKASPTKTTAPRPATAPRTLAPKAAPTNPTTLTASKPRVPLSSRTSGTASKITSAATTKVSSTTASKTLLAPKPTSATPPKPKTLVSSAPKPRAPLTKTITKGADVEKEKKDSANKLTASRTTTISRTTSGAATTRTTTTTVRKTEAKLSADRTSSRVTVRNTTLTKKPNELKTTKTKTTKVEKPKENGVAPTTVTQEIKEITIVNNMINQSESDTDNLVKDNSPLDNKLLIDPNNVLVDANLAD